MTFPKQKLFFYSLIVCLTLTPIVSQANTPLVEWTFPSNPDDAVADGGIPENLSQEVSVVGASAATYTTSGATSLSARATGWHSGSLTKYWQIRIDTRGYQDITLSSKQRSSTTGPRDFVVEYRIGESSSWQTVPGGIITLADNFTTGTIDTLPLPPECSNQELVFIRFMMTTNVSVNGNTVLSTGASRIDDILIGGTTIGETEDLPDEPSLCKSSSSQVKINELLPYATTGEPEYVELINQDTQCVDLSGWRFEDDNHHKYMITSGTLIDPDQYLSFFGSFFLNNTSSDTLYLFDSTNTPLDNVKYDQSIKDFSYSFDGEVWNFTSFLTPGALNLFEEREDDENSPKENSGNLIITELLPNPEDDEVRGEYIELWNADTIPISLTGWGLRDNTSKVHAIKESIILDPGDYLPLSRSVFKFSLNNSGRETVTLVNPDGESISTVTYENPPEALSYSFNGEEWRFSEYQTPGEENKMSKTPKVILTSPHHGLVGTPIIFQARIKNKTKAGPLTYLWDFGDGRRSTLKNPKHVYARKGKYIANLRIRGKGLDTTKSFVMTIRNYPKVPLVISALSPNPQGKDTDHEWIEIVNTSNKDADLTGWQIATGKDKGSLINHPFKEALHLAPGATKRLTHKESAFNLNNTESVVELRSPDDETLSTAVYNEEKIPEDAVCLNIKEVCDFLDSASVRAEDETKEDVLGATVTEKTLEEDTSSSSVTPLEERPTIQSDQKKILRENIRRDLNLLIRLYVESWTSR